jgi:2-amino-4-hydroxy-6-hydroxymethyldihydropteridine diphosphokinase
MARVYVGLGSNLGDSMAILRAALQSLQSLANPDTLVVSSLYSSSPMGPQDQADYLNSVAGFETALDPVALLDALQAIEQAHARERNRHWGERTLDLDLLFYDDLNMQSERLTLPHPGIAQRDFVLKPLAEIYPSPHLPHLGALQQLLAVCPSYDLRKLYEANQWR